MVSRGVFRAVVGVFVVLAIAAAFSLAPIQDETYYWAWSRAPALAYVDHPPATAWILAGAQVIFGIGLASLRVPALVSMLIVALVTMVSAARLGGDRGLVLVLLLGAPMFAIGYLPATPDVFQGVAAALAAYAIVRAFADDRWAFAAAFVLIASVLIKHSSALLAIGAFAGALLTSKGRELLAKKTTWLGLIAGFVVIAPWLYADLGSENGSFAYQTTRVFARGTSRGPLAIGVLVGGVMIALGPATAALLLYTGARDRDPVRMTLFGGALALIVACLLPVWLGGGELNWSMPALAFAAPALAAALQGRAARIAKIAGLASTAILCVLLVHIVVPFVPIAAKKDTTRRGAGFEQLAHEARAFAAEHQATTLITRRYQVASMLRYHLADQLPVLELGTPRKSQYDAWPRPPLCAGDIALVVHQESALPKEIAADAIAPAKEHHRKAGDEILDRWVLTPVRATRDLYGPCAKDLSARSRTP